MEKVKYSEEVRYVWECPKCGQFNEECDDLSYEEMVTCEGCEKDFQPERD